MRSRRLPCDEARGLLDERLDRPLRPEETTALDAHLASCASCLAASADLDRVHHLLGGTTSMDPGPAFSERVVAALDRGPGMGIRRGPGTRSRERMLLGALSVLGTAAVAALAVAVLPIDAAAASVADLVPGLPAPALPEIPPQAAGLFGEFTAWMPPWASAAGAAAALLAAAAQVASIRRRPGGPAR